MQQCDALYNSANDGLELLEVEKETEAKVGQFSFLVVFKITPDIIKEAAHKLKSSKSDPEPSLIICPLPSKAFLFMDTSPTSCFWHPYYHLLRTNWAV